MTTLNKKQIAILAVHGYTEVNRGGIHVDTWHKNEVNFIYINVHSTKVRGYNKETARLAELINDHGDKNGF